MTDYLLYAAVLVGVAAAGYLVARSPAFWIGLVMSLWPAIKRVIVEVVLESSPETQARAREDSRQHNEPGRGRGPER